MQQRPSQTGHFVPNDLLGHSFAHRDRTRRSWEAARAQSDINFSFDANPIAPHWIAPASWALASTTEASMSRSRVELRLEEKAVHMIQNRKEPNLSSTQMHGFFNAITTSSPSAPCPAQGINRIPATESTVAILA